MKCNTLLLTACLCLTACSPSAKQLYEKGSVHFNKGEFKEALPFFEQAIMRDANNPNLPPKLSIAYAETGNWGNCVEYGNRAIKEGNDFYELYSQMTFCHEKLNQWDQALVLYQEGIKKYPDRYRFQMRGGNVAFVRHKYDLAAKWFGTLARQAPKDADYAYNAGMTYQRLKKYSEAKHYYEQILKYHPEHATAHFSLGSLADEQGKWQEAKIHYEKALEEEPEHLSALLNLAQIQEKNDASQALMTWKKYLEQAQKRKQPAELIQKAQARIHALGGGSSKPKE